MTNDTTTDFRSSPNEYRGQIINGRYELLQKLGSGGFGAVHLALDNVLERQVAIKFFDPVDKNFNDTPDTPPRAGSFRERFLREAKILAQIQHPNIITIFDFGTYRETPFIVVEYLEKSLAELMDEASIISKRRSLQVLTISDTLDIFLQIAEALAYLHGLPHQILHRDLKPSNVMFTNEGVVKLLDFGLARQSGSGMTVTTSNVGFGSWIYMAPEQRDDARNVDHRADIYSFGRMLFLTLTGTAPNPFGDLEKPSQLNPHLTEEWDRFILKAGAYQCAERYSSTTALVNDLKLLGAPDLPSNSALGATVKQTKRDLEKGSGRTSDSYSNHPFTQLQTGFENPVTLDNSSKVLPLASDGTLPKRRLRPYFSAVLGLLLMSLVLFVIFHQEDPLLSKRTSATDGKKVLIARQHLPIGSTISEDSFTEKKIASEEMEADAVEPHEKELFIGKTVVQKIIPGQQITWSLVATAEAKHLSQKIHYQMKTYEEVRTMIDELAQSGFIDQIQIAELDTMTGFNLTTPENLPSARDEQNREKEIDLIIPRGGFSASAETFLENENLDCLTIVFNDEPIFSTTSPFFQAVEQGDLTTVKKLVKKIALNATEDITGLTPLHVASARGHLDVVNVLLSNGAKVQLPTPKGLTALHFAAAAGYRAIVEILLEQGAPINSVDDLGRTPLHYAVLYKHSEVIETLITQGADLTVQDKMGLKPLLYLSQTYQRAYIKMLQIPHELPHKREHSDDPG